MNPSRMRIMTVADTSFMQSVLVLFVEAHPDMVLVGEAHNCEAAVQVVVQRSPDILLMDLNMLDFDGIQAIRQIKAENPQIHIILLTAENNPDRVKVALSAGADVSLPYMTLSDKLAETIRMVSQAI
jgi:DNA-binding NarL/FixJ family response regulator